MLYGGFYVYVVIVYKGVCSIRKKFCLILGLSHLLMAINTGSQPIRLKIFIILYVDRSGDNLFTCLMPLTSISPVYILRCLISLNIFCAFSNLIISKSTWLFLLPRKLAFLNKIDIIKRGLLLSRTNNSVLAVVCFAAAREEDFLWARMVMCSV